jgi:hypothetical protein
MPNSHDLEDFLSILKEAVAHIEDRYFQVQTAFENGSSLMYRERVYCYELYHQLRNAIPVTSQYTLMGELDKRAHEIISGSRIPDFVFHVPGTMDGNLVVMEVKRIDTSDDLKTDFKKLLQFLEDANYKGAVHLVFGSGGGRIDRFREIAKQKLTGLTKGIFVLLWHKCAGETAQEILRLDLRAPPQQAR